MIFFVWSLVADAVNYSRRSRLSTVVSDFLERRTGTDGMLLKKIAKTTNMIRMASAPVICSETAFLYKTDTFQITSHPKRRLQYRGWSVVPMDSYFERSHSGSPIFFVADLKAAQDYPEAVIKQSRQVEKQCPSIAWRTDEELEIVFACPNKETFLEVILDWAENTIFYKEQFQIDSIEVVDLEPEFHMILARNMKDKPACVSVLERVFMEEISAARDFSESLREGVLGETISGATSIASSGFTSPVEEKFNARFPLQSNSEPTTGSRTVFEKITDARAPLAKMESESSYSVTSAASSIPPIQLDDEDTTPRPSYHFGILPESPEETPRPGFSATEKLSNNVEPIAFYNTGKADPSIQSTNMIATREELGVNEGGFAVHRGSVDLSRSLLLRDRRRLSLFPQREGQLESPYRGSRVRRRSMSPLIASPIDSGGPIASDGVSGWRRANSFRSLERRRYSSIGGRNLIETLKTSKTAPPNVLIYIGEEAPGEPTFRLKGAVQACLDPSSYAVYLINQKRLLDTPWPENTTCLLIMETESLGKEGWERVEEYFRKGGKLLFICQNRLLASLTDCKNTRKRVGVVKLAFSGKDRSQQNSSLGKDFEAFMKRVGKALKQSKVMEQFQAKDLVGGLRYSMTVMREEGSPLVLYMQNGKDAAGALFTDATLEALLLEEATLVRQAMERLHMDLSTPNARLNLTSATVLTSPSQYAALATGLPSLGRIGGQPNVSFSAYEPQTAASESEVPVVVDGRNFHPGFNSRDYFAHNRALHLGRCVLFIPVATSTMDILSTLVSNRSKMIEPIVVIAQRQTKGKGRGGNQWLSPEGCAMFSFPLVIPLQSKLGKASGFIQHLLALSVIDGIQRILKIEDFPLKLKWPNDVYFHRSHKMGGVLVNCTVKRDNLFCIMGCGINVSNAKPTLCVNDLLPEDRGALSIEAVIGAVLTRMEELVADFQDTGPSSILPLYYRHWLHSREEVGIGEDRVVIRGLDPHGFLEVRSKQSGKIFSVQPDGNSFDMMRNLIKMKP